MKQIIFLFLLCVLLGCKSDNNSVVEKTVTKENSLVLLTPDELYPELFPEVQLKRIFPDGKTFVDCTAKNSAEKINSSYNEMKDFAEFDLQSFVSENFDVPGSISSDFRSDPSRSASDHVEALWPILTREADKDIEGSTLIPLPYQYIVPGGRFREVYYWDSYFTMLGLIKSEKFELIENILDNFAYLITTIGHIPNGNRTYYKTRSQPPFFSQMVKAYSEARADKGIIDKYLPALIKEYSFWMNGVSQGDNLHTVSTDEGVMNRYYDIGETPRPESYKEDYEVVESARAGKKMYRDLRSGAESGWDYSSRWFADGKTMSTIETTDIIPIDLNALLFGLEELIKNNTKDKALKATLDRRQQHRISFMNKHMWNEEAGCYEDYNWVKKQKTGLKSLAMVYPLFFNMASKSQAKRVSEYVEEYFLKPGGVVTTLYNTGQQWDAPNGWAPLQWMTIIGLDNYGYSVLAQQIASRWIAINERVYKDTGKFVEKYNVEDISLLAGGGEYPVQDGFGWSNGVYLACKAYLQKRVY